MSQENLTEKEVSQIWSDNEIEGPTILAQKYYDALVLGTLSANISETQLQALKNDKRVLAMLPGLTTPATSRSPISSIQRQDIPPPNTQKFNVSQPVTLNFEPPEYLSRDLWMETLVFPYTLEDGALNIVQDPSDLLKYREVLSSALGQQSTSPMYAYSKDGGGQGTWYYLLDTDYITYTNPDLRGRQGNVVVPGSILIEADLNLLNGRNQLELTGGFHSDTMASLAVGRALGVAPNAAIVPYKADSQHFHQDTFLEVANDIISNNRVGRAVMGYAVGFEDITFDPQYAHYSWQQALSNYNIIMDAIAKRGIPIFAAQSNNPLSDDDHVLPDSIFGPDSPMISIGHVNTDMQKSTEQPTKEANLYTLGQNLPAYRGHNVFRVQENSNSLAQSIVAGLALYLISLPDVRQQLLLDDRSMDAGLVQRLKSFMQGLAYPRVDGGPSVVWNGADFRKCIAKREAGSSVACNAPLPSTAPIPMPNPKGTNLHVNSGCILINGSPRCSTDAGAISSIYESSYNVMPQNNTAQNSTAQNSTELILAGFDSDKKFDANATATCELQAYWPNSYGDIYFGADGCLYDSQSNRIFNQCCVPPDANNSGEVINPYLDPRPAASCDRSYKVLWIKFEIHIKGWVTDGGQELWKQVAGCGALTGKGFGANADVKTDGSDQHIGDFRSEYVMTFNLPATFKTGCVGRAIVSAGGPQGNFC
ncbi:hypothetical protein BGZ63DRAFT_423235 [Mariannaea sp. PMI_226]|nr:hypothetical protein BGZ63DRAFT_423235 [Mariannaea sp. PMI_226]